MIEIKNNQRLTSMTSMVEEVYCVVLGVVKDD